MPKDPCGKCERSPDLYKRLADAKIDEMATPHFEYCKNCMLTNIPIAGDDGGCDWQIVGSRLTAEGFSEFKLVAKPDGGMECKGGVIVLLYANTNVAQWGEVGDIVRVAVTISKKN